MKKLIFLFVVILLMAPGCEGCGCGCDRLPAGSSPLVKEFVGSPDTIVPGKSANLEVDVVLGKNGGTVTIDHDIGPVEPKGSYAVTPPETTEFGMKACNENGCVTATTEVTVEKRTGWGGKDKGPDIVEFSATPIETAAPGEAVKLKYKVMDSDKVSVADVYEGTWVTGTVWRYPQNTTTYEMTAWKGDKTDTAEVTVWVAGTEMGDTSPFTTSTTPSEGSTSPPGLTQPTFTPPTWQPGGGSQKQPVPGPVIDYFYAASASVPAGTPANLYWGTTYTDKVTVVELGQSGLQTSAQCPIPDTSTPGTFTFTLKAGGPGGPPVTKTTQLTVTQQPPPSCKENKLEIVHFTAHHPDDLLLNSETTIDYGEAATLSWEVSPPEATVEISGVSGGLDPVGNVDVQPKECTDYVLTATCGSKTIPLSAKVAVCPVVTLTSPDDEIELYESVHLEWHVEPASAEQVYLSWMPGSGIEPPPGVTYPYSEKVDPVGEGEYTPDVADNLYTFRVAAQLGNADCMTCYKGDSWHVKVTKPPLEIEEFLPSSSTINIVQGQSVGFEWIITGCTDTTEVSFGPSGNLQQDTSGECISGEWKGFKDVNNIQASGSYVVQAVDGNEQVSQEWSINVSVLPPDIDIPPQNLTLKVGEQGTIQYSVTGSGPLYVAFGTAPGVGQPVPTAGYVTVQPQAPGNYTYYFSAEGAGGMVSQPVTVVVTEPCPTIEYFRASCTVMGGAARETRSRHCTISWSVTGPAGTTATIDGQPVPLSASGVEVKDGGVYTLRATCGTCTRTATASTR